MTAFVRALRAEQLKIKGTLALWLAVIIPLGMALLQFGMTYDRGANFVPPGEDAWIEFLDYSLIFWALLGMPLFITLEMALLGMLEHRHDQWKHLFAQPLPRWAIYAAKQAAGIVLIGLSLLAMGGGLVVAGLVMRVVKPEVGFGPAIPWGDLFTYLGLIFLGSWLVTAIQTWVSVRWPSFALASAVGIVMTVSGAMVINAEWGRLWPWALSAMLFNEFRAGETILTGLLVGSLGGLVAAVAGGWEFCRRDVL